MRKLHKELHKLKQLLARTSLSSQSQMVQETYADCCLKGHNSLFSEMFHPFSPCYETNGAERHGSRWSQHSRATEWKIPYITSRSQSPLAWLLLFNTHLKMSQHKHCSWSLELIRRLLSHPKSNATIFQETLLEARQRSSCSGGAIVARKHVPHGCEATPQSTLCCPYDQEFTCELHLSQKVAPTISSHLLVSTAPICPNLFPETRYKAAGQNPAAFNLPDKIRRLRAFRLLCSAAIKAIQGKVKTPS